MTFLPSINIVFGFVWLLTTLGNYYMLRDIIWSIVWCDRGGKYNSLKKLKLNKNIFEKISMRYLEQFTNNHRKNYKFWMKLKQCFEIIEVFLLIVYFLCCVFSENVFSMLIRSFIIIQGFIIFIVVAFQFDTNRKTKYDRIRERKKSID